MAGVHFVTGKLGAGKTLTAVGAIQDYLSRGCTVATNLDIDLKNMFRRGKKNLNLIRVPDKPTLLDFQFLGNVNPSYDTSKNGLLVLDELGTWFNSRAWGDKSRQGVIDWLIHARKFGFDIIFIVQDISLVDKQARMALCEHLVICKRLDRMKVPIISTLISVCSLGLLKLPMPKVHVGIVKYGDTPTAMTVDKWVLLGTDLYSAYDTKQIFSDKYDKGVYTELPPYYRYGRYHVPFTIRNIMRITKIYFRKYSRPLSFAAGLLLSFGCTYLIYHKDDVNKLTQTAVVDTVSLDNLLDGYHIKQFSNFPNQPPSFELVNSDDDVITSEKIISLGISYNTYNSCKIKFIKGQNNEVIYC